MLHFNFKFAKKNAGKMQKGISQKISVPIVQDPVIQFKKEFRTRSILLGCIILIAIPGFIVSKKNIQNIVNDIRMLRGDNVWQNKNFEGLAILTAGREKALFLADRMKEILPTTEELQATLITRVQKTASAYHVSVNTVLGMPMIGDDSTVGMLPITIRGEGNFDAIRAFLSDIETQSIIIMFKKISITQKTEGIFEYTVDGVISTRPKSLTQFEVKKSFYNKNLSQDISTSSLSTSTPSFVTTITQGTSSLIVKIRITETPTGFLNVREMPSTSAPLLTKILPGEEYETYALQEGWYGITLADGRKGWVSAKYVFRIQ